jgi:tetratricopeptide (TPR) repeat protein
VIAVPTLEQPHAEADRLEREGQFAFHRNAFSDALEFFRKASTLYLADGKIEQHLEAISYVLRILAEKEEFNEISLLQLHVRGLLSSVRDLPGSVRSRVHYILGVCDSFQAVSIERAAVEYSLSIDAALSAENKKALAYPIYGLAFLAFGNGDHAQARLQLDRLKLLLEHTPNSDLSIGSIILHGLIERNEGRFDSAMELMWEAYRELKTSPNMILYIHAVHGMASVCLRKGDLSSASNYLELAESAFSASELPRLGKMIESTKRALNQNKPKVSEDYRLDCEQGVIFNRWNQSIHLGGQFVLRELAKLFFLAPGKAHSKDDIVRAIWGEPYDPVTHDNRIYVTIRRLKLLLERGEGTKTSVIVRTKAGYQLNPALRVCVV